jgi:hypothetical protein
VEAALSPEGKALHQRILTVPPAIAKALGLTPEQVKATQQLLRQLSANAIPATAS